MNKKLTYNFLLPVCLLYASILFSQNLILDKAQGFLKDFEIDSASTIINAIDPSIFETYDKGRFHFIKGKLKLLQDTHNKAFEEFLIAKKILKSIDSSLLVSYINLYIIDLLNDQKNSKISSKPYLDEYIEYAKKSGKPKNLSRAYSKIAVSYLDSDNSRLALAYFDKAIFEAKKAKDTILQTNFMFNKAVVYNTSAKKYDSALYLFKKTLPLFIKRNKQEYISYNYNNQAEAFKKLNEFDQAILFYKKADSINLRSNSLKTKRVFYENISDIYNKAGNYKQAYIYAKKLIQIKDSIDNQSQNNAIIKAENKYRAAETEKENLKLRNDNLESDAKRIQNRNLLIGSLALLFFGGITAFLIHKNTKRKQYIAEQEREIQIQRTEKLLKEQELNSIDAMILGQEKERQRLANDLHDNLGSTLATVKLHFDHIKNNRDNSKIKNIEELYNKTDDLLNEAYYKVRTIAHEKNSGVIAKQGLLPAIKNLAKKASNGEEFQIEVQDHGLDERLDNTLEISIFRIIQELITNAIKHANASEISILLTNHDSLLNIIIEDNGKGFNAKKLPNKDGIGLKNIEKRIEHQEGTFEIDSTIGKGTNIIINIPI